MPPPATANGPTDMIRGMMMGLGYGMLIFGKSGSKVKVKNPQKLTFWANFGYRG